MLAFILCFISVAAALVNVNINSSLMCVPFFNFSSTRVVRTAVLPEPAPAETIILVPVSSIAFFCSGVQAM